MRALLSHGRLVAYVVLVALLATTMVAVPMVEASASTRTPVMRDKPVLTEAEVRTWFQTYPGRPTYRATVSEAKLVEHFATEGQANGVDWNIAFAQAILETAWFNFPSTGQVKPADNNFGGMGAYDGQDGQSVFKFPDARTGVRAKMQHLRIYADPNVNTKGTNLGAPIARDLDDRYPDRWRLIRNGTDANGLPYHASAQYWQDFGNGRWATDPHYSCKVLNLYRRMLEANGRSTTGLPTQPECLRAWHLRYLNAGGKADLVGHLGVAGDRFLACDWNGNGQTTPASFRDGLWTLAAGRNGSSPTSFYYGGKGDIPLCGDWNDDGVDTVGIVRGGHWHLRNSNSGGPGQIVFTYGQVTRGDVPIVGDWNGNGQDTPGIIRDGEWHLRNSNSGGPGQIVFTYGRILQGDRPLVGDWNGNGRDTIGIVRGGEWHLRNSLSGGAADHTFIYGKVSSGDIPLMGDWTANGIDTPAIVR